MKVGRLCLIHVFLLLVIFITKAAAYDNSSDRLLVAIPACLIAFIFFCCYSVFKKCADEETRARFLQNRGRVTDSIEFIDTYPYGLAHRRSESSDTIHIILAALVRSQRQVGRQPPPPPTSLELSNERDIFSQYLCGGHGIPFYPPPPSYERSMSRSLSVISPSASAVDVSAIVGEPPPEYDRLFEPYPMSPVESSVSNLVRDSPTISQPYTVPQEYSSAAFTESLNPSQFHSRVEYNHEAPVPSTSCQDSSKFNSMYVYAEQGTCGPGFHHGDAISGSRSKPSASQQNEESTRISSAGNDQCPLHPEEEIQEHWSSPPPYPGKQ